MKEKIAAQYMTEKAEIITERTSACTEFAIIFEKKDEIKLLCTS